MKQSEKAEKEADVSKKSKGADSDELRFQDSTYVELALRVLGLMCDGQNRTLQVGRGTRGSMVCSWYGWTGVALNCSV